MMEDGRLCQWSVFRSIVAILQWWGFNVTVIIMNKWIFQVIFFVSSQFLIILFMGVFLIFLNFQLLKACVIIYYNSFLRCNVCELSGELVVFVV